MIFFSKCEQSSSKVPGFDCGGYSEKPSYRLRVQIFVQRCDRGTEWRVGRLLLRSFTDIFRVVHVRARGFENTLSHPTAVLSQVVEIAVLEPV